MTGVLPPISQIGDFLTGAGGVGFLISIFMKLNRFALVLSNVLFFSGIFCILGKNRTVKLFTEKGRIPATACMCCGIILVAIDYTGWGFLFELIGAFLIFGGFLPFLMNKMRKLPVVGQFFNFRLPMFIENLDKEELPR